MKTSKFAKSILPTEKSLKISEAQLDNTLYVLSSQRVNDVNLTLPQGLDFSQEVVRSIVKTIQGKLPPNQKPTKELASSLIELAIKSASLEIYQKKKSLNIKPDLSFHPLLISVDIVWFIEPFIVAGHLGEGRIYLIREDSVEQLNEDHTYAASLIRENVLSEQEAKKRIYANEIEFTLGTDSKLRIDLLKPEIQNGDKILLCTSGVYKSCPEQTLRNFMPSSSTEVDLVPRALDQMIKHLTQAKKSGGAFLIHYTDVLGKSEVQPKKPQTKLLPQIKAESVRNSDLFRLLSFREITLLLEKGTVKTFNDGTILGKKGDVPDEMWVILSGRVIVKDAGILIAEREYGSVIGESLLMAQELRSADIVASHHLMVLEFKKDGLLEFLEGYMNNTAARVYKSLISMEYFRLKTATEKNEMLTQVNLDLKNKVKELQSKIKS